MEHPCHQCGAAVEDGMAFCRQCNAPQIRVLTEPPAELPLPPAEGIGSAAFASFAPPTGRIQWLQAFPAAVWGALLAALSMRAPLGTLGLGMLTAGALTVLLYRRRVPGPPMTKSAGAKLGAVAGGLGFGILTVLTAAEVAISRNGSQLRAALIDAVDKAATRSLDPQAQAAAAQLKSPAGLAFILVAGMLLVLLIFLLLTSLGGVLGTSLIKNRR